MHCGSSNAWYFLFREKRAGKPENGGGGFKVATSYYHFGSFLWCLRQLSCAKTVRKSFRMALCWKILRF